MALPIEQDVDEERSAPSSRPAWLRLLPLTVIVLLAGFAFVMGWHRHLSLEGLVRHRDGIEAFVASHRLAALAAFAGVYCVSVALSLPGAAFLTVAGGLVFGTWAGGAAALIGATAGATVIFLIAKTALGGWLTRKAGPLADRLADGFRADAFNYLLFLRLVPLFPFWLVNLVPALAGVNLRIFVGATAIGIVPGTFAFASFGAGLDSAIAAQADAYRACLGAGHAVCRLDFDIKAAATPQLLAGLAALGVIALLPLAVRRIKARRNRG